MQQAAPLQFGLLHACVQPRARLLPQQHYKQNYAHFYRLSLAPCATSFSYRQLTVCWKSCFQPRLVQLASCATWQVRVVASVCIAFRFHNKHHYVLGIIVCIALISALARRALAGKSLRIAHTCAHRQTQTHTHTLTPAPCTTADDMGIDQIEVPSSQRAYGYTGNNGTVKTPAIHKLASEGMVFQT